MFGGASVQQVSELFGRKWALMSVNSIAIFAIILMFSGKYANMSLLLLIGRLLIGVYSGLGAGLTPMYLSEIAPDTLRGALGIVYNLILTFAILVSQGTLESTTNDLMNDAQEDLNLQC